MMDSGDDDDDWLPQTYFIVTSWAYRYRYQARPWKMGTCRYKNLFLCSKIYDHSSVLWYILQLFESHSDLWYLIWHFYVLQITLAYHITCWCHNIISAKIKVLKAQRFLVSLVLEQVWPPPCQLFHRCWELKAIAWEVNRNHVKLV